MKSCIFVDGENFRYAIKNLFSPRLFDEKDYLPKNADWTKFYDKIVQKVEGASLHIERLTRVRTYWYVVDGVDTYPLVSGKHFVEEKFHNRHRDKIQNLRASGGMTDALEELKVRKEKITRRFEGFQNFQRGIAKHHNSIEFRRSGAIGYDLFTKRLGKEKTVDVNLGVDLLLLKDVYDVAILVSGDQDYLPAVQAVKNLGKTVINIAFETREGKLLPGGARRLNETTDWNLALQYEEFAAMMNLSTEINGKNGV